MKPPRKTTDEYQVMQHYSAHGWEIVGRLDTFKQAQQCAKDYRDNMPQYPTKIKKVRVKNEPRISPVTNREKKIPKSISISASLWDLVNQRATALGVSASDYLCLLVKQDTNPAGGSQASTLVDR